MHIRNAVSADLGAILETYETARRFMAANGNPIQWKNGYPYPDVITDDIAAGQLYVAEDGDGILGVFMCAPGPDATYAVIEGAWPSDAPYGVIHRVANSGRAKGLLAAAVAWASKTYPVLRMDTHADNKPMQHLLEKLGFVRCGIIHVEDGTPRIAYQKS